MESPETSKTITNAPISTTTATSSDHVTVQMFEACEGCGKDVEVISAVSVNTEFNDMEASQQKCGIRRRGLFEEAHLNTIADSSSSSNLSNISKSPASISNTENIEFSRDVSTPTSSNRKLINLQQSMKTIFSPHNAGNSSLTVPKPSGIGLHLNSIVSALPVNYTANASSHVGEKDCIKIERMNPASRMNYHLPENGSISSSIADDVLASSEDGMSSLIAASSTTSELRYRAKKPLDNSLLKPQVSSAIAHKKRKFQSEHAESFEHHNQSSPKKKMTMAFTTSDGEGCKRCNCKRTKCLKLYCDCFAAGSYCTEACACQGCFNRPEYEDTVHETRQQIESRNPLAFVPKVLQTVSESPADILEELSRLAPSSARHKRGCNCKKSMCLKKYCECYQANVGCSDGCRCEGCKNVHGRKEDHGLIEESVKHDPLLSSGKEMVDIVSYDQELFCVLERVDPSSPSYDGLVNLYNDTPSIATVSSASYGSEVELCPGNGRLSSGGSLRWCSSPITPMTQLDDTKILQGIDSNSGVYDILEDGTPDILKESIPIKTVNVSSPNRKRVSLPYKQLHNLGSSSSGGLRSRKFILQAVPSFPPLAMCINAKGSTHQNKSDIQEDSINK